MSRDDQDEIPLPPHGKPPAADLSPMHACNGCGTATPRAEMALYGARCKHCYERFCCAKQPPLYAGTRNPTADQAEMLKAIERHRERHSTGGLDDEA